jgi:hypothetical protein
MWTSITNGHPDFYMATGNVYPAVPRTLSQHCERDLRAVFRNLGNNSFEELLEAAGPGVAKAHRGRGCAFGDFDNDGEVDMLMINLNENPSFLRNDIRGNRIGST